jgi:hypothetical protein
MKIRLAIREERHGVMNWTEQRILQYRAAISWILPIIKGFRRWFPFFHRQRANDGMFLGIGKWSQKKFRPARIFFLT